MYRHVVRKLHSFTYFWYLDCDPQRLAVELLVHYCPGGVDMALHGVPTVPARRECCALQVDFRVFHKRAYRKKERGRGRGSGRIGGEAVQVPPYAKRRAI